MLTVNSIQAFQDNYIWLLINTKTHGCVVVDPGDAIPVLHALQNAHLSLQAILITHHHHDHTGGIAELREQYPGISVYGSSILREQGLPSIPSTLSIEKKTNPFLRCEFPDVIKKIQTQFSDTDDNPVTIFFALRKWKDHFTY